VLLWHYTAVLRILRDRFLGSPRPVADAQCVINDLLARLGTGGLANVNRLAVGACERDGDAILAGERAAYPLPAQMDPGGLELKTNGMHEVVGEHRDEQVPAHPIGLAMEDGPQPKLGFELHVEQGALLSAQEPLQLPCA